MFDISVIICCYNPDLEKFKKTIFSIINQQKVSIQIVISDDGSNIKYKDQIVNWCNRNNIKNIFYNFLTKNVGTVKNILAAVKCCDSKYVKVISPGDYLFDVNTLSYFLNVSITNKADLIFGDAIYYTGRNIVQQRATTHSKLLYFDNNLKNIICLYNGYFQGAAFIARKEIYSKILTLYEDKVKYVEDRAVMYSAFLENKKVIGLPVPMIWYEFGTGISTSNTHDERLTNDQKMIYKVIKNVYPNNILATKMIKKYKVKTLSKFLKAIYFMIYFPGIYVYHIKKCFCGYLTYDINIEMQDRIVTRN